jgi:hypothetical protein
MVTVYRQRLGKHVPVARQQILKNAIEEVSGEVVVHGRL